MRTGSPVRTVKRGRRPAGPLSLMIGPRRLGGHDRAGERLAGGAQLGQDERVLEGALGVVGGLRALQPVQRGPRRRRRGRGGAAGRPPSAR